MNFKRAIAGTTLAALCATLVPAAPALADGKASTRNILLGIGAATYLIIQHNRKVHERYAEDARRQAELQSENRDAWAAYSSEKRANDNALAEISDLKREVAYQHSVIVDQRNQLAMAGRADRTAAFVPTPAAHERRNRSSNARRVARRPSSGDVAMVSYGWGSI
ncbi:MAG TPA: hypothetical protein VFA29_09945 [Candidatus Baltobacteraceae bacterium]|nr:hypothetical protein [Candidatus Baltobacteraceae bacterium]